MCLFYFSCENTITNNSDILDCAGVPNGIAELDDCGLCTRGTTIFEFNYLMDCEGVCGGSAVEDCTGMCNGSVVLDDYGCCGDNSTCMVINEINYNSSLGFDPKDWVELHNYSDSSINIGNWTLKDNNNKDVSISGATQIRAGVIRPEIFICTNESFIKNKELDDENLIISIDSIVRVIREPFFGKIGKVILLPSNLKSFGSRVFMIYPICSS